MAQIIKLPLDDKFDNPVLRETKRRVWWTLFMADRWCSSRSGLPLQIRDFDYAVDLPIDEYEFQKPDFNTSHTSHGAKPGLWAYKITLVKFFAAIQDLNRSIAKQKVTQVEMDAQVSQLARQLSDWERDLPAEMRMSEQSIEEYRLKGLGGAFIDLHLGFHHYSTLLFFSYLDDRHRLDPSSSHYPQLCKSHALKFSELLRLSREEGRCEVVHAPVAHMTIVSSAVLVHMLLFGDEKQSEIARNSLLSNFETLLELKQFWPSSERLVSFTYRSQDYFLTSNQARSWDSWQL